MREQHQDKDRKAKHHQTEAKVENAPVAIVEPFTRSESAKERAKRKQLELEEEAKRIEEKQKAKRGVSH